MFSPGTLMDKRLSQLKEAKERFDRSSQSSIPKIQRVPKFLRQNERFYKYCSPKIISFGPIHHNNISLGEGEHYKLLWTSIFVAEYGIKIDQDANQACKLLFKMIEDNIEELKNMFTEEEIQGYNDDDLAWILFVDGCSLIYFMENIDEHCPKALNLKFDQLMYIWRDALLLENQLPRKMIEILCKEKGVDMGFLDENYGSMGECKRSGMVMIQVVANKTDEWTWSNISFKSKWFGGELRLPTFLFNDVTPYLFRNLIAYEMCPDVHYDYECCSFFSFMDSLVDNAEDVKELRLAGVFQNLLGSDDELAKLFNDLGDDLPTKMCCHDSYTNAVAYSKKYIMIKLQIEKHYTNKWKTWLAQAYNTYFNSPWAMIAFLAASLALVLTFIQTWFTIHPN
ncbi:uncharacterized protein LOC131618524 [Vicia villosa]|uniref:uncharacterized protein LOC131618524 n=1 Tax=Vicia villosa TaxID=3911 RepID=UPI00273C47A8|nr:uncharacterized protein LOC131618524 [Vicia villosa]XP_058745713.1 uncharacterized protein LOC131618524 [Vicia villosa]